MSMSERESRTSAELFDEPDHCRFCGEPLTGAQEQVRARRGDLICQTCWVEGRDLAW